MSTRGPEAEAADPAARLGRDHPANREPRLPDGDLIADRAGQAPSAAPGEPARRGPAAARGNRSGRPAGRPSRRAETRVCTARSSTIRATSRPSAGRDIVGVSIDSVRSSEPNSASRRSIVCRASVGPLGVGRNQHVRRDQRLRFASEDAADALNDRPQRRRWPRRRRRCTGRRTAGVVHAARVSRTAIRSTNIMAGLATPALRPASRRRRARGATATRDRPFPPRGRRAAPIGIGERRQLGVVRHQDDRGAALARESSRSSSMMCRPLAVSRLPVGSSARTIGGSLASARASATRCCSPPDSWDG